MKDLLPFFKLLKPVRLQFALALLCGLIYGVSSGFGIPTMAYKVFPFIFDSEGEQLKIYTELSNGKFYPLDVKPEAHSANFYIKSESDYQPLKKIVQLTAQGRFMVGEQGKTEAISQSLYVNKDSQYVEVKGGLFTQDSDTKGYKSLQAQKAEPSFGTVLAVLLIIPTVFIFRGASNFFNVYFTNYCGLAVLEALRLKVFLKLQHLPIAFFHRHKSGDLLNRLMGDTAALQAVVSSVASDLVRQPITLVGAIGYLIYQSLQQRESMFILLCFAVIGCCVFPIRFVGRQLLKRAYLMQEQMGSLSAIASENLSAYREVRAFNLQERELSRFQQASRLFLKLQLNVVRYNSGLSPTIEVVTAIGISIAIYYAKEKGITLGEIIPLILALYMSYDPIKKIGAINNSVKTGLAALQRLNFILNEEDETPEAKTTVDFPAEIRNIQFEQLCFAYDTEVVLKNLNLNINKGDVVALVGPSGAGKSTFGALIPRFYDPQAGKLSFNGLDIRSFKKQDLRQHIGIVSQDTVLFDDTVANNIRLGHQNASDEAVRFAAEQAQAHEFIQAMELGYNTRIGERGTRLSGGQKQRLAIARSFLRNAPILILDEATSALDSESEAKIQQALEKLIVGKTVFIIAHRFSTIKLASRILVFNHGEVVGNGSHEELMANNALYRDLHQRQELN